MVVGLPFSAAFPALVLDHEAAQAADGAPELPKFLQQEAQIRAEARETCGSLAQRGGSHHPNSKRASRAGEDISQCSHCVLVVSESEKEI